MAKKKDKKVEVHSVHRPPAWRNWRWKYFPQAHQAPLAILIRPYYHVAGSQREHMLIDLTINSTIALHPSFFYPFLFPTITTNGGDSDWSPKKHTLKPEPRTVRVMHSASMPYQWHHFSVSGLSDAVKHWDKWDWGGVNHMSPETDWMWLKCMVIVIRGAGGTRNRWMCKGRIGASLVSGEWSECVNTNAHMKGEAGKFMKIAVHAAHALSCVLCT